MSNPDTHFAIPGVEIRAVGDLLTQQGTRDLEAAREIFREYILSISHIAGVSFEHQNVDKELASLPGKYAPPDGAIVLAWEGEECVGCAAIRPLHIVRACELKRMYVKPSWRGKAVGRRLCLVLFEMAEVMGYRTMMLDSDPELKPAIALYRSLGFIDAPRYNDDPDPTTVYMARALKSVDHSTDPGR